jgi:hypothetical protein
MKLTTLADDVKPFANMKTDTVVKILSVADIIAIARKVSINWRKLFSMHFLHKQILFFVCFTF